MQSLNEQILKRSDAIKQENTNMAIKDYIKLVRDKYYPELDISFIDFFMDMYEKNKSISAELLATYGVLSIKPNRKSLGNSTIERLLKRCHLLESVDYSLRLQLGAQSNTIRGVKYKDVYYLTPKAFKVCFISSENETNYRDYCLFLEECVHYYNIGQVTSMEHTIIELKHEVKKCRAITRHIGR